MTVLYFGIYNPNYPRNRLFIKGLRANGVRVIECNARGIGPYKYLKLIFKHFRLRRAYDIIIVGFPGQTVMALARRLTKKPIIFDTFLSFYDSEVFDRKNIPPNSPKAKRLFKLDQKACLLADLVLVDTKAHLRYFSSQFGLPKEKFREIFVGTDDELFAPGKKRNEQFIVHVHGKYIPLQGLEYIVEAARILQNYPIHFRILGRGQEYNRISSMIRNQNLHNIQLVDMVPYEKLKDYINDSDICLGIFGSSEKTQRVIPNKVVEYLACGKAIITSDSPAIRELLEDGVNIRLCRPADPEDLARKIMELYKNPDLRQNLGREARKVYLEKLTPKILGAQLKEIFNELTDS